MMLAAAVLLPQLLTGSEPPGAVKLATPRVQYRVNEASATRSPWIDSNGARILRSPATFVYHVNGEAAALAAAEAFTYGASALVATDAAGTEAFNKMLDFLRQVPQVELAPVADIGVIDDGSGEAGELMNLLGRLNLLYKVEKAPDPKLRINVKLGSKEYPAEEAKDPSLLAHKIRSQIGDENRSLRIYGSDVVVGRLLSDGKRARIFLINYSNRPVRGLRVRVRGTYMKSEPRVYGTTDSKIEDLTQEDGATEFSIPEFSLYAVVDLF